MFKKINKKEFFNLKFNFKKNTNINNLIKY